MATAPGVEQVRKFQAAGFSSEQINEWKATTAARFTESGFSKEQIDRYFGAGPISTTSIMQLRDRSIAAMQADMGEGADYPKAAEGFREAFKAGFQTSISGLSKRKALPDLALSEDANFVEVFSSAIGQFVGDLPVSVPSFFGGAAASAPIGAGAGGAASPNKPLGAAVGGGTGAVIGGEAISGFVTEATRQALINFYRDNQNAGVEADVRDFTSRLVAAIFDPSTLTAGAKGGAVGAASAVTGGTARLALKPAEKIGGKIVRQAVISSAEVTTAVTAAAALEGELPRPVDFAAAGALVLGLDTSIAIGSRVPGPIRDAGRRLEDHYIRTGERPEAAADRARKDPVFRQEIVAGIQEEGTFTKQAAVPKDNVSGITNVDPEPIVIDAVRDGEAAVEGARASVEKLGDTVHSAVVGAARPNVFKKAPEPAAPDPSDPVAVARAGIRGKIKSTKRRPKVKDIVDDLRYEFVNDLQYAVSQSESAYYDATGKRLAVEDNPGELMRLAFGAHAQAELQVRKGVYTKDGKKVFASFDDIIKPIEDPDFFVEYAIARRVIEKHNQNLETGFDPIEADLVIKKAEKDTDFKDRFRALQKWQNLQIDAAQKAGLISKEDAVKIVAHNQDYVPFARVLDADKAPPGATVRGLPVRKPTKQFKGSDRDILDPLEVMVKNRYAIEQLIENNNARKRLVDFSNELPDEFRLVDPAKKKITVTQIAESDTQVAKFLEENGLNIEDATALHVYRAVNKDLGRGDFIVFEDGKPVVYTARDPKLVATLQRLDATTQNALIKMLRVPSAMLRAGVTLNPEFSLKASLRDQLGAVLQNKFAVVPFLDMWRGLTRLVPGNATDPLVIKWINNGGANSALLALDAKALNDAMSNRPQTYRERAWNLLLLPARKAAAFSMLMENAMRVGRFERALDEGLDMQTAALQSRDVTLDFGRMGARVRAYNMITTWLGAGINGIDRFQTAFSRDPKGTMIKTAAFITLPSMILYFMNKDEEWYQDIPEWEKMLFWHFPIGQREDGRPDKVFRLPMPFQFGTIFGYLPTKMFDEFSKAEPKAGKALRDAIATAYSVPLLPTAITPLVEIGINHSFFTGGPIVSQSQERILPEYQYTPNTTELSRKIAKALATIPGGIIDEKFTSPIAIEHMVRGYGGTIGTMLLQELDTNLRKIGYLEDYDRPDPTITDNPVYGAFFSRNDIARQSLTDFYENAAEMEQIEATIRQEVFRGNPQEVEAILRRRGFPALKPAKTKEALGKLRKMAYAIHFDKEMTGTEKRQLIDEINKQQVAIARAFNEQAEEFRRREKERK